MSDKDFKVKNKLQVKGITSAGPVISDSVGNLDSTPYIATQYGGTGTSTSPNAGQILYSAAGTTYAPTTLSSVITQQTPTDGQSGNKTYVGTTTPSSPVTGDIWIDNTAGSAPQMQRWSKTAVGGETSVSGLDDSGNTLTYVAGTEQVYHNGVLLVRGSDYIATDGVNITSLAALQAGDIVNVITYLSGIVAGTVPLVGSSTITGAITTSLDSTFNTVKVGLGGGSVLTNTAIGAFSLSTNTTGATNTSIGYYSLKNNTTGQENASVGYSSLSLNTIGVANTSMGAYSLALNTTGNNNTAIGRAALYNNTIGSSNVAVGREALNQNTTGDVNVAIGTYSLYTNSTGAGNIAVGTNALAANTNGSGNVAVGHYALQANTTGVDNIAIGRFAGYRITTGQGNVAIGRSSQEFTSTGSSNTSIGFQSLLYNTTGQGNTAVGQNALLSNIGGSSNVAIGQASLTANTIGNYHVAIGFNALRDNTTGSENTAVGTAALEVSQTGQSNVALGFGAGRAVTSGSNNVIIGRDAANTGTNNLTTGTNNIIIGYNSANSSATGSNIITLGNSSIATLRCQQTSITALSDMRDKSNINGIPAGLDFVNDLRPVIFTWDTRPEYNSEGELLPNANDGKHEGGFIAQELLATEEKFNTRDWSRIVDTTNEDRLEAAPGKLIPILVKAIQELSAGLNEANAEIAKLKGNL